MPETLNTGNHIEANVAQLRIGRGTTHRLAEALGPYVVTTMPLPWEHTRQALGRTPEKVFMVETMEEEWLEARLVELPPCDTVVGIGGGQAIDAAKYFAWRKGIRLVSIPTILSVDAFVTPAAGIRRNHQVAYVGHTTPDPLVIDFDILRTAPPDLNIAGIGDLLSIHTATFDWELAQQAGRSEYAFSATDVAKARRIVEELSGSLDDIRRQTDKGLAAIVMQYLAMNAICLQAGHYRVEEGSEHYLFYELEERLRRPFVHGHIIGLGILLMSRLQDNHPDEIREMMDTAGLRYQPRDMQIAQTDLMDALCNLKSYRDARPDLWHTIIDEVPIRTDWAREVLATLAF